MVPPRPSHRSDDAWPSLRVEEWTATRDTLHIWTQVAGKVRLAKAPMINHWWQVPLYVTPRGLTTSATPRSGHPRPTTPPEGGQFRLPYEVVRRAEDPDRMLLDFFQTTYEAAAGAG